MSLAIRKGDSVRIRCGRDKGRVERVIEVIRDSNGKVSKLLIEHVNMKKRHTRATRDQSGGIVQKEAPIDVSNAMLVDPKTNVSTRFGSKIDENGRKVRVSRKSGDVL